jgi:hypothetical protein
MQFFRNAVFSAPISFFVLASLRHALRFTCRAAASPGTVAEAEAGAVEAGLVGGAAVGAAAVAAAAVAAGAGACGAAG